MGKIELTTDRLILNMLNINHTTAVLDYFTRNKEFLAPWEAIKPDDFYTEHFIKRLIDSEIMAFYEGTRCKLYILKKENPTRVIGSVCLSEIVRGCFQSCFLGYRLDKDEINNGYMTEAVKCIVDFGFDELKLHRIEANIMPRNSASLSVVKKTGFYNEGLAKNHLLINGKWEDHIHMVKLSDNYE